MRCPRQPSEHWGQIPQLCQKPETAPHGSPVTFTIAKPAAAQGLGVRSTGPRSNAARKSRHTRNHTGPRRLRSGRTELRRQDTQASPAALRTAGRRSPVLPPDPARSTTRWGHMPQPGPRARPPIRVQEAGQQHRGGTWSKRGARGSLGTLVFPAVVQPLTPVRPSTSTELQPTGSLSGPPQPTRCSPLDPVWPSRNPQTAAC